MNLLKRKGTKEHERGANEKEGRACLRETRRCEATSAVLLLCGCAAGQLLAVPLLLLATLAAVALTGVRAIQSCFALLSLFRLRCQSSCVVRAAGRCLCLRCARCSGARWSDFLDKSAADVADGVVEVLDICLRHVCEVDLVLPHAALHRAHVHLSGVALVLLVGLLHHVRRFL